MTKIFPLIEIISTSVVKVKKAMKTLPTIGKEADTVTNSIANDAKSTLAKLQVEKKIKSIPEKTAFERFEAAKKINSKSIEPQLKELFEKIKVLDPQRFTNDEVKAFTFHLKRLQNTSAKEFAETLVKDENIDKLSLASYLGNLSENNVELYKLLYPQKMQDGTRRFAGVRLSQVVNALKSKDPGYELLYEAADSLGKPRFSGNDIFNIQHCLYLKELIKSGIDFDFNLGILPQLPPEFQASLVRETSNVINLKNVKENLLSGEDLSLLLKLSTLDTKLDIEKLLKTKNMKDFSFDERKDLLYAIETVKLQAAKRTRLPQYKNLLPDFKKLDLLFVDVDGAGKLDTKRLAASLVDDGKSLIKVRALSDFKLSAGFKKGMSDLETALAYGKFDVANIKTIKLKYTRADFIKDAKLITSDLSEVEAKDVMHTFGFDLINDDLIKYPVKATEEEISQISNIKVKDAVEKLNANVERFTVYNKASIPEFPELEKALNEIIEVYPEFLTSIGKKQHLAHLHTLDLHMLKTLQGALRDSRWSRLTEEDKKLAEIAILFHDIAKPEGKVDKLHQVISAEDVSVLLKKIDLSEIERERVVGLVRNHHWLEEINQPMTPDESKMLAMKLAFEFRKPNDWQISQIFAKADLEAVSDEIYDKFGSVLKSPMVSMISKNVDRIHSAFIFLPQTKIPKASKLINIENSITSTLEGETKNKVVNLSDNADLQAMGFVKGTTPENFRALVHIIDPDGQGFVNIMDGSTKEGKNGVFSASYVTKDKMATLFSVDNSKNKDLFDSSASGIVFEADQSNIAAAYPQDMDSGRMKSTADIMSYLFVNKPKHESTYLRLLAEKGNESSIFAKLQGDLQGISKIEDIKSELKKASIKDLFKRRIKHRTYIPSKIKHSLGLSSKEYRKLISQISIYNNVDDISNPKIKNAIAEAADSLMDYKNAPDYTKELEDYIWNEIVLYAPKPQAVFAKTSHIENVPFELRKYAQDHDLPVILFSKGLTNQ